MSKEIIFLNKKSFEMSVKLQFDSSNFVAFGEILCKFSNKVEFSGDDKSMLFNVILLPEFEMKFCKF